MTATKTKLSVTVSNTLAHLLDMVARDSEVPKSELVEEALKLWHEKRLEEAAKEIADVEYKDLPTDDEWLAMNSSLLNEWEWKE